MAKISQNNNEQCPIISSLTPSKIGYFSGFLGFTIIELSITLMLVAILAWMGIYGYGRLMQREAHHYCATQLLHDLAFAKLAAIERSEVITLCASHNTQSCAIHDKNHKGHLTKSKQPASWQNGYIILDSSEQLLIARNYPSHPPISLTLHAGLHQEIVQFTPEGKSRYALRFEFPNKQIILPQSGRARLVEK